MSDSETLRALADRQAITDLIHRYCRAVDRIDEELGYSIWHGDGIADYGEAIFQGTGRAVIDWICAGHRKALGHFHQVSNISIDLDGDRAGSETYITANMRMMRDEKPIQITLWGRYIDRWSRQNGRWGLDKRMYIRDLDEIRQPTPYSQNINGRRDRDDASYGVLRKPV